MPPSDRTRCRSCVTRPSRFARCLAAHTDNRNARPCGRASCEATLPRWCLRRRRRTLCSLPLVVCAQARASTRFGCTFTGAKRRSGSVRWWRCRPPSDEACWRSRQRERPLSSCDAQDGGGWPTSRTQHPHRRRRTPRARSQLDCWWRVRHASTKGSRSSPRSQQRARVAGPHCLRCSCNPLESAAVVMGMANAVRCDGWRRCLLTG